MHRSAVGADPSKNMKAFEDILLVVISGYIVAAANAESENINCLEMAKKIVSKLVKVSAYHPPVTRDNATETVPGATAAPTSTATSFTTDLLSLGLMWHGFHDTIREGDGDCILLYW